MFIDNDTMTEHQHTSYAIFKAVKITIMVSWTLFTKFVFYVDGKSKMDVPQDNGFNMGPCGKNINMFISETINLIGSILYIVTEWSFTVFLILC